MSADRASLANRLDPEFISEVLGQLEVRLESIIQDLMNTYRERIPSYAAAPPTFLQEVRMGTTVSFQVAVAILRGEQGAATLAEPLKEAGRRRAAQGIPLGDTLLAWHISARAFWETINDLIPEESEEGFEALEVATLVILELLETAVAAISAGYMEVEQARVADEEHDIQSVIETLGGLRQRDANFDAAAERRNLDPAAFKWCFVVGTPSKNVGDLVRTLRHSWPGAAIGRVGESVVCYCAGSVIPPNLDLTSVGAAPIGTTAIAYSQARSASRVAAHLGRDLVRYAEVVPLAMILDAPEQERQAFRDAQLGGLLDDPLGTELAQSLRAFFAAGQSVAAAARELHVHRHTLEYRLERAQKLISGDLKDPLDRLLLELALAL